MLGSTRPVSRPSRQPATGPPCSYPDRTPPAGDDELTNTKIHHGSTSRCHPPLSWAHEKTSVVGFVLEGELELGAIGDRPALVQVNVLLDDLGHPQIAERPALAVLIASAAASSHEVLLVPMISVTLYTLMTLSFDHVRPAPGLLPEPACHRATLPGSSMQAGHRRERRPGWPAPGLHR